MITLKKTIKDIKGDLPIGNSSLKEIVTNYLYEPRFRVLLNHRIGKYCSKSRWFLFRQIGAYYRMRLITKRNCYISYNSVIGKNVKLPHPIGIIIGEGVIINDNVKIFQQVTFGSHGKESEQMSYPIIEKNVTIFAGAKIIGGIIIGENSIIGANAVVNISVPANSIAVGIPCRIINKELN